MIIISNLTIHDEDSFSKLQAKIEIDGKKDTIWFKVDRKYGKYLCSERSDAFVIGVLNYAMRNGHDITCHTPMSEDLYYQITTYLIDAVFKGSKTLYKTKIITEVDSGLLCNAGAVGTGISCGIDSLHVLVSMQSVGQLKRNKITHLCFNNVGSHGEGEPARKLYSERKKLVENFCMEYHYKLIESDSNIMDVIPQNHLLSHTYTSSFAIYALQKLYSIYYYASSGHSLFEFSIEKNEEKDCALYELLTLNVFTTERLRIYSEGITLSRLEKARKVVEYEPSYKYLNVCVLKSNNCGKCEKCVRTLLAFDALKKLDLYQKVFDIDYYKKHRQEYYSKLVYYTLNKNSNYIELYPLLKNEIKISANVKGILLTIKVKIAHYLPVWLKAFLKTLFR